MKYLLAILLFASCSKKQCYTCDTVRVINGHRSVTSETICGMTKDDARQYEHKNTYATYKTTCQ